MNAEDFRKIINNRYKMCMMDCQFPTGALAELNRAEFFAYEQFMENEKLKKDNANMRKTMRKIYDHTIDYYEKLTNYSDDSNNQTQLKKTNIAKKIIVTKCYECQHKRYFEGWGTFCRHKNIGTTVKKIIDLNTIPDWCPLNNNIL